MAAGCWAKQHRRRQGPEGGPEGAGKGFGFSLKCEQKLLEGFEQGCGLASFILYRDGLPVRGLSLQSSVG